MFRAERATFVPIVLAGLLLALPGCQGSSEPPADPCAGLSCDDTNPCTDDRCVAGTCQHDANAAPCDDGSACTTGDACAAGSCRGGAAVVCPPPANDQCWGAPRCDPAAGCAQDRLTAGTRCEDGNACTIDDACDEFGACAAIAQAACIPPGNPGCYSAISCDAAAGCQFELKPAGATCVDGDACTAGDACDAGGGCRGSPVTCPAGPCQVASCDPADGCHLLPADDGAACDDGNPCTGPDQCTTGRCGGAASSICDDGNACTADTCDAVAGCRSTPVVCDDGNACTADACDAVRGCTATPIACDDGDRRNGMETCDPAAGCATGTPLVCDDADVCNGLETCSPLAGCVAGPPASCDDGNACTADVCNGVTGCVHFARSCDDGNACTTDVCDPVTGACAFQAVSCGDGNACTDESCDPATGCAHTPVLCDDSDPCNGLETCDPQRGCTMGAVPSCDDGQSCTADVCASARGCVHLPLPSTTVCGAASCEGGSSLPESRCSGTGQCLPSAPVSCGAFLCDPASGRCRTACVVAGDCAPGFTCDPSARCVPIQPDGSACVIPSACQSGHCVDAVCCSTGCGGTCQRCNQPGAVGRCVLIANGADPDAECAGSSTCDGAGACTP